MPDEHIELALDWGTFKWSAACVRYYNGKRVGKLAPLWIRGQSYEVRMMAAWIGDLLVQGFELETLASRNKLLSDQIIHHFKLCLYDSPDISEVQKDALRILKNNNKDVDMLIADHLAAVLEDCKDAIRKDSRFAIMAREKKFEKLLSTMRVRITVPQIWTPTALRRMQAAAKRAGFPFVVLAYEPRCALAFTVHQLGETTTPDERRSVAGKVGLCVDLGSGTADLSLYELQDDLTPSSHLKARAYATGELCGSFQVDLALYDKLYRREGGRPWLINVAAKLNVTEGDFMRRALFTIEEIKRRFQRDHEYGGGYVHGANGDRIFIEFNKKELKAAFEEPIARIIQKVDELIARQAIDIISLTGGFSKSWYVEEKLKKRYSNGGHTIFIQPQDTQDCPVAIGALIRYDSIERQKLPSQFGYALLQREEFTQDLHKEAWSGQGPSFTKKPWVLPSPYDATVEVVDDRINNIIHQGTTLSCGEIKKDSCYHEYFVPVKDPKISAEFVYLTKEFLQSAASRKHGEEHAARHRNPDARLFRKGVHPWVKLELPLSKSKLLKAGFEIIDLGDGTKHFKIDARVVIEVLEADMRIGFELLKPARSDESDSDGDSSEDEESREVFETFWDTVWDSAHSEFAQL